MYTSRDAECAVVVLSGELDCAVDARLRAELQLVGDAVGLVIDLRGVTFMDSTGVHVLLEADQRCRARGARLIVAGSPQVQRTLAMCGLAGAFQAADPADPLLTRS